MSVNSTPGLLHGECLHVLTYARPQFEGSSEVFVSGCGQLLGE